MKRSLELDIIRAAAVIMTIFHHASLMVKHAPAWMAFLTNGTWIGVDLFFVLSGFLVAGLLFREYRERGEVKILHFLARRGFKIYPAFYFLMLLSLIFPLSTKTVSWSNIWPELIYVQNYFPGLYIHTWSLAVEEHFYILLAAVVFILISARKNLKLIPWIGLFVGIACLAARFYTAQFRLDIYSHRFPTHMRIDSLMVGVVIAYYYQFHRSSFTLVARKLRYVLLVEGLALLMIPFFNDDLGAFMNLIGYTTNYLGAGMLVMAAVAFQAPGWLAPIGYIGNRSYSIYLWHIPVLSLSLPIVENLFPYIGLSWIPIYIIVAVLAGILMAALIEQPFLALRDRYFPKVKSTELPSASEGPLQLQVESLSIQS